MKDTCLLGTAAAFGAFACVVASAAHAAGEGAILKHTAAYRYTTQDYLLLRSAVNQALAASADGNTVAWSNPKSKASGNVTPLERRPWNGLECRHLRIETSNGVSSDSAVYRFCRTPSAGWKLTGPIAS